MVGEMGLDAELTGKVEDFVEVRGRGAEDIEVDFRDMFTGDFEGLYGDIEAMSFDEGAVVHEAEDGWITGGNGRNALGVEDGLLREVHDDMNLSYRAATGDEAFTEGFIGCEDQVRKGDGATFDPAEKADEAVFGGNVMERHEELGHGIMQVEDDTGAEAFGQPGGEHQEIGHVMGMHEVKFLAKTAEQEDGGGQQEKGEVLDGISHHAASALAQGKSGDLNTGDGLVPGFAGGFTQAQEFDGGPCFGEGFGGAAGAGIGGIVGIQEDSDTATGETGIVRSGGRECGYGLGDWGWVGWRVGR
jgi:hypothetical protein